MNVDMAVTLFRTFVDAALSPPMNIYVLHYNGAVKPKHSKWVNTSI